MPLRVCLIIDSLGPNAGNEILVAGLANGLDRRGVEVHVVCFEDSQRMATLNPSVRKAVFPLARLNSLRGFRQIYRFHRYLKENQIDAVHGFVNNATIFGVLASLGGGCRVVITSRLNCGYWYTTKWVWICRALNLFSTHIFANSQAAKTATAAIEKISPDRISVVYPGVDLERFAPVTREGQAGAATGIPNGTLVVGIVANLRPVKDLSLFLKAAAQVGKAVPKAVFLLVGQGPLKHDLQTLAAQLGIGERVFFSSPGVPVVDYLSKMSVACLSSTSESLPNAILEYMASGLPVVATDVGGVSELVRHELTGYLVGTRSPEAFAEPIIRLLGDNDLRTRMGGQGYDLARKEFHMGAAIERFQRFYTEAVVEVQERCTTIRPPSTLPTEQK